MEPPSKDRPLPASDIGAEGVRASFLAELDRTRYTVVDEDWAGGVPAQYGVAPRVRIGHGKWFNLLWLIPIGLALLLIGVAVAQGIRGLPAVQDFIRTYPGTSRLLQDAPVGIPAWIG